MFREKWGGKLRKDGGSRESRSHLPISPIMALAIEDLMKMAFSLEETMTITVQTSVGGTLPIRVRMSDPTGMFPRQFADQAGLNPRMVGKFRFYLHADADQEAMEWDEDKPLSYWRSVHFSGKTWKEVFPGGSNVLSLYLAIEDDSDEERRVKLSLLRSIVQQKGWLAYSGEDTQLWGEYLQWFLYARDISEKNRYETVLAFVERQSHLFVDQMM